MSRSPRRGDLWWADLETAGARPAVLLTSNAYLPHLTNVTVAMVTGTIRGGDTEVVLEPADHAVAKRSAVNCHNIFTIPKANLIKFMTQLDIDAMNAIDEAIGVALDLP